MFKYSATVVMLSSFDVFVPIVIKGVNVSGIQLVFHTFQKLGTCEIWVSLSLRLTVTAEHIVNRWNLIVLGFVLL